MTKLKPIDVTETPSWWTPSGWTNDDPPEPYSAVCRGSEWNDDLIKAGYGLIAHSGSEYDGLSVEVYMHTDGHLVAVLSGYLGNFIAVVLIKKENRVQFLVEKYPEMIAAVATAKKTESMSVIEKGLIAFVRHGHGERTIDRYGEKSLDDVQPLG